MACLGWWSRLFRVDFGVVSLIVTCYWSLSLSRVDSYAEVAIGSIQRRKNLSGLVMGDEGLSWQLAFAVVEDKDFFCAFLLLHREL